MASKEVKKLQVAAEALGYRVYRVTSKNRTIYQHKRTGKLETIWSVPSDYKGLNNALARLRAGAK